MKNLFYLSMTLMFLISCGDDNDDLIGTWTLDSFTTECPESDSDIVSTELIEADENGCYNTAAPDGAILSSCQRVTLENDGTARFVLEGEENSISEQTWTLQEDGTTLTLCRTNGVCNEFIFDDNTISLTLQVTAIDLIEDCQVTTRYSKK